MIKAFKPQRALISVSDKTGLVELARVLHQEGVELIATSNTAILLKQTGLPVTDVSTVTGFPEMMDGRVKTLHPAIHAGLLARSQDHEFLKKQGIGPIELVIVNLYPFEETVAKTACTLDEAIEHIDIGGPSLIRAAAKNYANTLVVVNNKDYPLLITCLMAQKIQADWRFELAKKAFAHTAAYDGAISNYLNGLENDSPFPEIFNCQFTKKTDLRYGENPHQQAIFYTNTKTSQGSLGSAELLQGKALSYNNLLDADAALGCVKSFPEDQDVCVIVKHTNPCGIASANNQAEAYLAAFQADPVSAYGGIIAFNHRLESDTVSLILQKQFAEVIIAPELSNEAKVLLAKKENLRVLVTGTWASKTKNHELKTIAGGLLVQETDAPSLIQLKTVTKLHANDAVSADLLFAWTAAKHVKSNAIVFAKEGKSIGIGGGQSSRVMSARIGLWQAKDLGFCTEGAVMASDAFIPFIDTLELAVKAKIAAVIQPGGSIRDKELIAYANEQGLIMVFTGIRHFKH